MGLAWANMPSATALQRAHQPRWTRARCTFPNAGVSPADLEDMATERLLFALRELQGVGVPEEALFPFREALAKRGLCSAG